MIVFSYTVARFNYFFTLTNVFSYIDQLMKMQVYNYIIELYYMVRKINNTFENILINAYCS